MKGASFYDRLWSGQWRELPAHGPLSYTRQRLMLRELRPALCPGARLLDVGCGDGTFLARLAQRFGNLELAGIDFSAQARQGAPEFLRPRLRTGDVERLQDAYPEAAFDVVTSCEVLEHVEDPAAVMRGIAHVLTPGGLAVFTVPLGMRHWSELDDAGHHLRRFELDEFSRLVEDHGLAVERAYGWGGPIARPYYHFSQKVGSKGLTASAKTSFGKLAGYLLQLAFRIDDFFPSPRGFQLICRARRVAG